MQPTTELREHTLMPCSLMITGTGASPEIQQSSDEGFIWATIHSKSSEWQAPGSPEPSQAPCIRMETNYCATIGAATIAANSSFGMKP